MQADYDVRLCGMGGMGGMGDMGGMGGMGGMGDMGMFSSTMIPQRWQRRVRFFVLSLFVLV